MDDLARIRHQLRTIDDPAALLAGVFAHAPIALQVYKADGHCLVVNRAFRELFGSEPPPEYNVLRDEIAAQPPYAEHVADVAVPSSHDPAVYLEALADLGCRVDAWETTYLHVLTGEDPVFTWVSGTGARPTLQALEPVALRERFEEEFRSRLREAYPPGPHGVVMPFRRVFVVAEVSA